MALGDNGNFFKVGRSNIASAVSTLDRSGGLALRLLVASGPPLTVNSSTSAADLNADKLDGEEASGLAEPRGSAHVTPEGNLATRYPHKGVISVQAVEGPGTNPADAKNGYCFDLAFTPKAAIRSPHLNNAAVVATETPDFPPRSDAVNQARDPPHNDAAEATYSSSIPDTNDTERLMMSRSTSR